MARFPEGIYLICLRKNQGSQGLNRGIMCQVSQGQPVVILAQNWVCGAVQFTSPQMMGTDGFKTGQESTDFHNMKQAFQVFKLPWFVTEFTTVYNSLQQFTTAYNMRS